MDHFWGGPAACAGGPEGQVVPVADDGTPDRTRCEPCAAGRFLDAQANLCTGCPADYYSDTGQAACKACGDGFVLPVVGGGASSSGTG